MGNDVGNFIVARDLIDQCSQSSFITESLCQCLKLKSYSVRLQVSEICGDKSCTCKKLVLFLLRYRYDSTIHLKLKLMPYLK